MTKEQVYKLALNRMNYTWEPDEAQSANVNAAIEEAEALLRARAGSPDLDLTGPEYRGLLIECVWYLANNRRAEFEEDYRAEIVNLRLAEGFGCGKEESTVAGLGTIEIERFPDGEPYSVHFTFTTKGA